MAARCLGKLWEAQRAAAVAALRGGSPAPAPSPPPAPVVPVVPFGSFRIGELRENCCRFACTPHHVPPEAHRFCGRPTRSSARNPHGSWCALHMPVVFEPARRPLR